MTIISNPSSVQKQPNLWSGILVRFAEVAGVLILQGIILFPAAGRLDWSWAWIFLAIYLLSITINSIFIMTRSPETVAERGRARLEKKWDQVIGGLWGLVQFLILPLIAGLDERFGWSADVSLVWHVTGAILFAAGLGLFGWAMITNAYFSTAVRIQEDRGQTVCRSGPYRFVRHPGYAGAILQSISMPLLLGSWWAWIPGAIAAALMAARTAFEDRMLQAELPGYKDFASHVHYRLIPGLW